ncbi:MAG: hypothetical protein ACLUGQ_05860 [Coprococcus sp.]
MRKKSHISLTKGVVHGLSAEQRFGHRLSPVCGKHTSRLYTFFFDKTSLYRGYV